MGFVVLLIALVFIYCGVMAIISAIAYHEGRDDATRYYGGYNNDYWMPAAYFYEAGYSKWEGKSRDFTTGNKNRQRFNRE